MITIFIIIFNPFKGRHFQRDIILWAVRWYCKYNINHRELQEMLAERGVNVDHTTIYRWRIMCLKWKSSLMLYEQFGNLKFKYRNRERVREPYRRI